MVAPFYRTPVEPLISNDQPLPSDADSLRARLCKHQQFISRLLDDHHDLIVYVPPMYKAEADRRFPVLYMQDGQNLFDPETSFIPGNHWRMGETADALIGAGAMEPLIIVGIYNVGVKRIDEYTPVEDKRLGGGQADAYGRMLVEELKPFIDQQYRTLPGAENCGMGGSSLGGLVTLYLGLRYPAVLPGKLELRIWLDIGTKESTRAVPDARALRDALIKKGWQLGQDLAYFEAERAEHTESAWAERVAPMLRFLFPGSAKINI
jgi:predicted alpha/beta superfamily hydrolase